MNICYNERSLFHTKFLVNIPYNLAIALGLQVDSHTSIHKFILFPVPFLIYFFHTAQPIFILYSCFCMILCISNSRIKFSKNIHKIVYGVWLNLTFYVILPPNPLTKAIFALFLIHSIRVLRIYVYCTILS